MISRVTSPSVSEVAGQKSQAANAPKAEQSAAQTAKATANNAGVAVSIGSTARSLSKDAVNQSAEINSAKVEAVKASIQDGTFVVNAEAIADKLLSSAKEFMSNPTNLK